MVTGFGTMLDQHNIRHGFRKITKAAGLGTDLVPRQLRHAAPGVCQPIIVRILSCSWAPAPPVIGCQDPVALGHRHRICLAERRDAGPSDAGHVPGPAADREAGCLVGLGGSGWLPVQARGQELLPRPAAGGVPG